MREAGHAKPGLRNNPGGWGGKGGGGGAQDGMEHAYPWLIHVDV